MIQAQKPVLGSTTADVRESDDTLAALSQAIAVGLPHTRNKNYGGYVFSFRVASRNQYSASGCWSDGYVAKMDAWGLMEPMELEELVQNLQKRAERLERRQSRFLVGTSVLLAVFLLSAWQSVLAPQENYKTRALSIVDSSGVVRLTLGAPVPNPIVDGKNKGATQFGYRHYL